MSRAAAWEALEREALAAAAERWRAGAEPCCAYEAELFAQWDAEGGPS